jgi:ABC-type multidrug transport system ATPase subunit
MQYLHFVESAVSCVFGFIQDEPTSGLDAVMCELICELLQDLACTSPKRIIMAAVHSPSSKLFTMFTHLLVLTSNSQLAYHGRRSKVGDRLTPRF